MANVSYGSVGRGDNQDEIMRRELLGSRRIDCVEESIEVHPKSRVVESVHSVEDELHFIVVEECAGNWRIRYELPAADTAVPPAPDEEHIVPSVEFALQGNKRRRRRYQTVRSKA